MTDYELVTYGPEHREDYLRLLREAWGEGSMSGNEFDWWFDGNPAGSLRSVAVMDDRVVGVAAHSLYAMVLDGERQTASFSVHATTDEVARGRGIFVELERKHEKEAQELGVACVLAFASAPTIPLFLGPLGWTRIGKLRVWARPVSTSVSGEAAPRLDVDGDAAAKWPNHVVRERRVPPVALPRLAAWIRGGRRRRRVRRRLAGEGASRPDDLRRRRPDEHVDAGRSQAARASSLAVRAAGARAATRVPRRGLPPHAADAPLHGQGARRPAKPRSVRVALHARRHGLLLMRRLVFITQQVDPGHPALAATIPKIRALSERVDEVVVLADRVLPGVLPPNCRSLSFASRTKAGRGAKFQAALTRELARKPRPIAVVAHMCPIYAVLAAPLARPLGVPLLLWFTHWKRTRTLEAAEKAATAVG